MSTRAPLVGIAPLRLRDASGGTVLTVRPRYVEALAAAGAIPVLLAGVDPALARGFVEGLDGLVLPGGRDIPPGLYGEKADPELEETLEDDLAQSYLAMARSSLELGVPTLGICLGFQVMVVARGGTLIQHLRPREGGPQHRGPGQVDARHEVAVKPGSKLHAAVGRDRIEVVSHHHQAAKALGAGLTASGWASDGLVEALEDGAHRFWVGVQWHPERSPEDIGSQRLFESFVGDARRYAMDRRSART